MDASLNSYKSLVERLIKENKTLKVMMRIFRVAHLIMLR